MDQPGHRSAIHAASEHVYICERCGERMEERQCKIICLNCGLTRDCSDP